MPKRIFVLDRNSNDQHHPVWDRVRHHGYGVYVGDVGTEPWEPEIVICMGVTLMEPAEVTMARWPKAKLFCYNWDVYEWVWTRPREGEYDYKRYGELLRRATRIWTPSHCTSLRTEQWYGLTNCTRILSSCPWWEHDNIRDDGYVLNCLREIPDPHWGMLETSCEKLNIPIRTTQHKLSEADYRDAIAGCRFIVAPLYELSTGGLSLMEAYYHGKQVLISDSPYNGGRDYFEHRAQYFQSGSSAHLEYMLLAMYEATAIVDATEQREYIAKNFSDQRMADDMVRSLQAHV